MLKLRIRFARPYFKRDDTATYILRKGIKLYNGLNYNQLCLSAFIGRKTRKVAGCISVAANLFLRNRTTRPSLESVLLVRVASERLLDGHTLRQIGDQ